MSAPQLQRKASRSGAAISAKTALRRYSRPCWRTGDGNASARSGVDRRRLDPFRALRRQEPTRPSVAVGPRLEDPLADRVQAAFDDELRHLGKRLRPDIAHRLDPRCIRVGQGAKAHRIELVALDLRKTRQDLIEVITGLLTDR
jgi:hypothetical protein